MFSQFDIALKDGFRMRSFKEDDQKTVEKIIFKTLEEYGLIINTCGVDNDVLDIQNHYKNALFGVVVDPGNKIKGCFALMPLDANSVELRKMYYSSEIRGKGLGKKVLLELISIAKKQGFEYMELETASALKEAIGLYEHMGFELMEGKNKTPRCDKHYILKIKDD